MKRTINGRNIKLLLSTNRNPHFMTITEYTESALAKVCEMSYFDNRNFVLPGSIRNRVSFLHAIDLARINRDLVKMAQKTRPDIFLEMGGHRILPETIKAIKRIGSTTALWTIDPPNDFHLIQKAAPQYDFVFCGGTEAMELLNGYNIKNIYWLPFACDPLYHKPVAVSQPEEERYGSDVVFVGSFYPNRARIFEEISDMGLAVWGPGWDAVPSSSPLKRCIRRAEGVTPEEWLKIYASSKMTLVVHRQKEGVLCYQASPRVYEALACKKMLLSDAQPDVTALFNDGQDLAIFKTPGHLRELIQFYINNPAQRERIAKSGQEKVLNNHTYDQRIRNMLDIMLQAKLVSADEARI